MTTERTSSTSNVFILAQCPPYAHRKFIQGCYAQAWAEEMTKLLATIEKPWTQLKSKDRNIYPMLKRRGLRPIASS